ncbi:MAG: adenosylhomocysteinase [Candidatus Diapherotrites archaeon]|nr:adenosylhomocysteinase [Candidatus Diapherotrites archaeon]
MQHKFKVKNLSLASQGELNIYFSAEQMPVLQLIKKKFQRKKPLRNVRIGMALHVTKETANLVLALKAAGAKIAIASCNPLSTQDDVAAALAKKHKINVFAWKHETKKEYYENLHRVLDFRPEITIDDGCDLVTLLHTERKELLSNVLFGTEETTTGVIRLKAMEKDNRLRYAVFAVNDNATKHLFDNYYGTGQSALDGVIRATNVLIAGKTVVVAGYGDCGKGIAKNAKGLGANVIVCEVNPLRALQARMDGFSVMPMKEAAKIGDIFITATGNTDVITLAEIRRMKNNAILANAGHFDVEIDVETLYKRARKVRTVRPCLDEVWIGRKKIYVCAKGRLVNLACAEGHPSEVMDLSFAGQALAVEYGYLNRDKLEPRVYKLPKELDMEIANLKLQVMRIKIDKLTRKQKEYLSSWHHGT